MPKIRFLLLLTSALLLFPSLGLALRSAEGSGSDFERGFSEDGLSCADDEYAEGNHDCNPQGCDVACHKIHSYRYFLGITWDHKTQCTCVSQVPPWALQEQDSEGHVSLSDEELAILGIKTDDGVFQTKVQVHRCN